MFINMIYPVQIEKSPQNFAGSSLIELVFII